jgi:hypothetical protein
MEFCSITAHSMNNPERRHRAIPVGAVAARSIMRRIIWLVLVCLIGLGAVVAIKIGAMKTPEGADVDKARVGTATEQGILIGAKNYQICDIILPAIA